jgi:cleavage stimulation factor subunit 3
LPSAYLGARLSISQAYEFALSHVGLDLLAGPIWKEYLAFVREGETRSQWEEQTKVADYRALAGRAVRVPFEGVEDVWREYDQFEGQVNRVTVRPSRPARACSASVDPDRKLTCLSLLPSLPRAPRRPRSSWPNAHRLT